MNQLDTVILAWFNQFARQSYVRDALIYDLAYFNLIKGTPFVLALLWLWLTTGEARRRNREIVVVTVIAAFLAVAVGQFLQVALPMKLRPMSRTDIPFVLPYTVHENSLRTESAFPSDTAMFFSAMATGLWFASRRLGVLAHAFAATFIFLPRIYVGLHNPTDILAGAALGIGVAALTVNPRARGWIAALPLRFADNYPTVAALVGTVVALQMATMFDDVRALLRDSKMVAQVTWCGLSGKTGCDAALAGRARIDTRAPGGASEAPASPPPPTPSLSEARALGP